MAGLVQQLASMARYDIVAGHGAESGDGAVIIRLLEPEDRDLLCGFFAELSPQALYMRFMVPRHSVPEDLLSDLSEVDQRNHVVLLAEHRVKGESRMIAEARYIVDKDDPTVCEFAIAVADDWCRCGIATAMLQKLEGHAAVCGKSRLVGGVLYENNPMRGLVTAAGYATALDRRDPTTLVVSKQIPARIPAH